MHTHRSLTLFTVFFAGFVGGLWGLWSLETPPTPSPLEPFDPFDYAPTLHPTLIAGVQLLGVLLVVSCLRRAPSLDRTPTTSYLEDAI